MNLNEQSIFRKLFLVRDAADGKPVRTVSYRIVRRAGQDFLLLPQSNRAAAEALRLYAPQTFFARLATLLLKQALLKKVPVPLPRLDVEIAESSHLLRCIRQVAGIGPETLPDVAILAGNPEAPIRKSVCLVFDGDGVPQHVIKVGIGETSAAHIKREAEFMQEHGTRAQSMPPVAGTYYAPGFSAFCMPFQAQNSPRSYREKNIEECLIPWIDTSQERRLEELAVWKRLSKACANVEEFRALAGELKDVKVHPALFHGDFVPWNIRGNGRGDEWVVIDWESGEPAGIPGWDWFHYVVQTGILVENAKGTLLWLRLNHLFKSEEFRRYAGRASLCGCEKHLLALYLLYCKSVLKQSHRTIDALMRTVQEDSRGGKEQATATLSDFWNARSFQSFWPTEHIGYGLGAVLAFLLSKTRIPPNQVSVLSLLVAVGGLLAVLIWVDGRVAQAFGIFGCLVFSFALDCADGPLARVTHRASRFGSILDKFIDTQVLVVTTGLLAFYAGSGQSSFTWMTPGLSVLILTAFLSARLGLSLVIWLKQFSMDFADRTSENRRIHDAYWKMKRSVGLLVDDISRILFICVAWAMGRFWDGLLVYTGMLVFVLLGYLVSTSEDLDG